jgi:hypothetical protein
MARTLHADTNAEVQLGSVIPFFMVLISTGGSDVAVWSGYGDYVSTVSGSSVTYLGVGNLGLISSISESQDLSARGINLSLSGIPSAYIALALGDLEQGKPVRIFMGFFSQSTRVKINSEFELWTGITDIPSINEEGQTATISISAENRLIDLEKLRVRRYTAEDQARDDVKDLGFEFVPSLQDKEVLFGTSR